MLQIAVHHHAAIALGQPETSKNRGFFAKIAAELHASHSAVFFRQAADQRKSLILGSVADKKQLVVDLFPLQQGGQNLGRMPDIGFFIV